MTYVTGEVRQFAALHHRVDGLARADAETEGRADRITMMSVHSAKGLEWPVVFLPGLQAAALLLVLHP